jgi:aldose sugar dehydrogenase
MKKLIIAAAIAVLASTGACAQEQLPFDVEVVADFDEPWALAFLPDGRLLVTEKKGRLYIVAADGTKSAPVAGVPDVDYGGQGGLGDVALHPAFKSNRTIYLSYAEAGDSDTRGAAVARAVLVEDGAAPRLDRVEVIWRQYPKVAGQGHYGHRLLFDDDGYLWVSSGERQKFTPAQDMQANLGKILRLNDDGSVPEDNPFVAAAEQASPAAGENVTAQIWSLGHRNPLGLALDLDGQLWEIEMGPKGGDELNRIERGGNYGYPVVSNGDHYDGRDIPDHDTHPEFIAPALWWTPVISPGDLVILRGEGFAGWRGNALAAGLSSKAIIRIELDGDSAREVARYPMGARMRAIGEAADGTLWALEDERDDSEGRLLKLVDKQAP